MFIGEYQHSLDAKGRIIIPSKFRDELSTNFILGVGLDQCLTIYTIDKWQKMFEELNKIPTTKSDARKYVRTLTSSASECELDGQGRIIIPQYLSKHAGIEKECVVIGANDHVEIWAQDIWDKYYEDASSSFEDIAEHLSELVND